MRQSCTCVQIALAAADTSSHLSPLALELSRGSFPSRACNPRRSSSVDWPRATKLSKTLLEEQKGQFSPNRQMVKYPLGSCKSSHIGVDTAEKKKASEFSRVRQKEASFKGVLCHASWHFLQCPRPVSREHNRQKSRGCKLETWR